MFREDVVKTVVGKGERLGRVHVDGARFRIDVDVQPTLFGVLPATDVQAGMLLRPEVGLGQGFTYGADNVRRFRRLRNGEDKPRQPHGQCAGRHFPGDPRAARFGGRRSQQGRG